MSTVISGRCWYMVLPMVSKAVLMSLADQANDHGVCWPSISTLCMRVCASERAVRNAVRHLESIGLIDVELGAMRSNKYTIRPERYVPPESVTDSVTTPAPDAPRHEVPPGTRCRVPGTSCPPPRHVVPPNRNRTNTNTITPIPPRGQNEFGDDVAEPLDPVRSVSESKPSRKKPVITLSTWLKRCEEEGVKPIPPDDPVLAYCDKVGIPEDFLTLHWREFKRRYAGEDKKQADWRRKFRLSVEGNWYRLWFIGVDGKAVLTTQGTQAKRLHADGGRDGQ